MQQFNGGLNTHFPHIQLYRVIHGSSDPDFLQGRRYETFLPFLKQLLYRRYSLNNNCSHMTVSIWPERTLIWYSSPSLLLTCTLVDVSRELTPTFEMKYLAFTLYIYISPLTLLNAIENWGWGWGGYHNFLVYLQVASDVNASFDRSYTHVAFYFTIQILCKYCIFMVAIKLLPLRAR